MDPSQHIVRGLFALSLAAGCASGRAPGEPVDLAGVFAGAPEPGVLRVELAFGAAGDLDLYVTDPLQETVYFANNPTRSGGRLVEDVGCRATAPRIETVEFAAPLPGRYRIGVDYPMPCEVGDTAAAPFAVRAVRDDRVWRAEGALEPLRFEPIVLELDLPE